MSTVELSDANRISADSSPVLRDHAQATRYTPTISVVINTYNRASQLHQTLSSLKYQTYPNFEVVVVNGPSTDQTDKVIEEFKGAIRIEQCAVRNLSVSRNIGIDAAAGGLVAFLDDDAIPDPRWLEELVGAMADEKVWGAGGKVFDHTGYKLQAYPLICHRNGDGWAGAKAPLWSWNLPVERDGFVHLMGCNGIYRRSILEKINGYDEVFDYFLDETDVCIRINDLGGILEQLDCAAVYHKFAPSELRNHHRVVKDPYCIIKNKLYFACKHASPGMSREEALYGCNGLFEEMKAGAMFSFQEKFLTREELVEFEKRMNEGIKAGMALVAKGISAGHRIKAREPNLFKTFATIPAPADGRLTIVFVSQSLPPASPGGIGRFTLDLARGMAALGHETHIITQSDSHSRVDLEHGVWIHRIAPGPAKNLETADVSDLARRVVGWARCVYDEVKRIQSSRKIDIVQVPIWDSEGLYCQLDPTLHTVLGVYTTLKTVYDMSPVIQATPGIQHLLTLEKAMIQDAKFILAPSQEILTKIQRDYGGPAEGVAASATVEAVHLGMPDMSHGLSGAPDGMIRILFLSRLEKRKGVDILFKAVVPLLREFANLELVLAGDDSIANDAGVPYRAAFVAEFGHEAFADRVKFRGRVSDEQVPREYADCDIFCVPSRFESFGLIFVEAMMQSKPVVGGRIGGMIEVVKDGEWGLLADPDSEKSLADCLRKLIGDPALRERMGKAARVAYEELFTLEKMVGNTIDAYRKMIGIRSGV